MPDEKGVLTKEDREKIDAWFTAKQKVKPYRCPVCSSDKWTMGDRLMQPITLIGNTLQIGGGPSYPQVMFVSADCGYTIYFNAVVIGVIPKSEPHKDEAGPNGAA